MDFSFSAIGKFLARFMPIINKQVSTQTSNGEITINLNLKIQIEGGNVSISAEADKVEEKRNSNKQILIPDEIFDADIPIVKFGEKINESKSCSVE